MTRYRLMLAALGALVVAAVVTVAVLQPGAPSTTGAVASAGLVPADQRAPAPEFAGITGWLNSAPLSVSGERGHVVLIDFWTFSCVNCVRTLPHVRGLADTYRSQGLVVVGVHSPEFDFERDPANVASAVRHLDVTWPVALDPQMATWNAWSNQYWPAQYLIDRDGKIAFAHFGEGDDAAIDAAVTSLLGVQRSATAAAAPTGPGTAVTSELYAGSRTAAEHRSHLGDGEQYGPQGSPTLYPAAAAPATERDAIELSGSFSDGGDHLTATAAGHVRLRFHAADVFMVGGRTGPPVIISATLDGAAVPAAELGAALAKGGGVVNATDLYALLTEVPPGDHVLDLSVPAGFSLFTFTFG